MVGAKKNGAREGHTSEKKVPIPKRVSLARSVLSCALLPSATTQVKDQAIIGKNGLLNISV